jgi:hypothetical protein
MQAIRIDRYEHKGRGGRRDIFIDPRERGDVQPDGPSQADQRAVLNKYITAIEKLREMLGRIRQEDTTLFEQYSLEKRFKTDLGAMLGEIQNDEPRISYAPYRLRWAKEVIQPLDELKAQIDSAMAIEPTKADPYLPKKEMEQLVAEMASDCNAGQLELAKQRYEAVIDRLGVPTDDPRHELAVAAREWQIKATTALDFKGLNLNVQGVVVNRDGRSGILLNGDVYEEGDYVAEDLLVKLVEEEQIWFVYRGLTLVRTM